MARPRNEKCAACAWLSAEEAREQSCWDPQQCRQRRSYYRHRDRRRLEKRQRYRVSKPGEVAQLTVEAPKADAALLVVYRETNQSPVCALEGRLFLAGELRAVIGPFSTLGYTQRRLELLTAAMLEQAQGYGFRQFTNLINRSPRECPIFAP